MIEKIKEVPEKKETIKSKEAPNIILKSKEERKEEWLNEEVTFEFNNTEESGAPLKFAYGIAKKAKNYLFLHGGKYTHPRRIKDHIESLKTPEWKYVPDGSGVMVKAVSGYKKRFQCVELFE